MKIREMFKKPIDRNIEGVIKIGQEGKENKKQELEEYVVTNELQKHFRDFFSAYSKGIDGSTEDIGVWISGFFGSGKSHLLKILSYLFSNEEIDGKRAIDYFVEDNKIKDEMVIADMKRACQISTDSILFNIDSKSESTGNKGKDDILKVFLKAFNEMQGFSPKPYVADLERELVSAGKYEEFKEKFEKISRKNWEERRNNFNFETSKVKKALVEIGFMTEEEANNWIEFSKKDYSISIEDFAKRIDKYIKSKGNNHHVIFFVDEVGQYIGNKNTDLMLNLQTITEDLGVYCKGKAWIVVTSQQAIDSITEIKGNDFSKIQGRFKTRLSLTSTDVLEVIKKRILEKNEYAEKELFLVYEGKESVIKNLVIFDDGIEKKIYSDVKDFQKVYPFIPYQFQILPSVLNSIRKKSSSGKHISEGERSMLDMSQKGVERYTECETGILVSFDKFYDRLQNILDASDSLIITNAMKNGYINPENQENCFNVNVLKVLFMIKYVKEIKGTLENITTLMVENINEDRIVLKEKVKEALDVLIKQTLVQKSGDVYIFLTNEEQEVEKMIDKIDVDMNEILRKISEKIFDKFYSEKKYQSPKFREYNFSFNQKVDDNSRGKNIYDIGVNIVTPNSSYSGNENSLLMKSLQENSVFIDLGENSFYINEIEKDIKIEKFLKSGDLDKVSEGNKIRNDKNKERKEHIERSERMLEEALRNAKYYVGGNNLSLNAKDYKTKITEALGKLLNRVYNKLDYITKSMGESDIRGIFEDREDTLITAERKKDNVNAIQEVINHIKLKKDKGLKINIKEVKDYFSKAPFGWNDRDIEWIVARAFKDGEIELKRNGNSLSLLNETSENIIESIVKKDSGERVYLEIKEKIDNKSIKAMKTVADELFGKSIDSEDTDKMIRDFKDLTRVKLAEIEDLRRNYKNKNYPGKDILENGERLLKRILALKDTREIFDEILGHEDDYCDYVEDVEPIDKFFAGEQKNIWDESVKLYEKYNDSKNYFSDEEIEQIIREINKILNDKKPYNKIKDLNELNKKFTENYNQILSERRNPILEKIKETKEITLDRLYTENEELKEKFSKKIEESFSEILRNAEKSENIREIETFDKEASNLKSKLLDEFEKQEEEILRENLKTENAVEESPAIPIRIKKPKVIGIAKINKDMVWKIQGKEDIENYLEKLRKELEKELEDSEIVEVEF